MHVSIIFKGINIIVFRHYLKGIDRKDSQERRQIQAYESFLDWDFYSNLKIFIKRNNEMILYSSIAMKLNLTMRRIQLLNIMGNGIDKTKDIVNSMILLFCCIFESQYAVSIAFAAFFCATAFGRISGIGSFTE
ncbi:3479_t:CDS:2 [Cetraspora pellucida]|uniref:3479_t:CDS:1 n=1 Tax=Cetraspora pellucida TaxID=1433469 RepID=A0A9N8YUA0_9GLOM|nr:3479_t:CDS:2 [Cetraspora pellucida]